MYCAYRDCPNVALPFSKISFFTLPTDHRRRIWIENSGNEALRNLSAKTKKVFCEVHFDAKDMRKQFMRTTLRKDAVPVKYVPSQEANSLPDTTALTELFDDDAEEESKPNDSNGDSQSDVESDRVEYLYVIDQEKTQLTEKSDRLEYFNPIEIVDADDGVDVEVKVKHGNVLNGSPAESQPEIIVPNKRRRSGSGHQPHIVYSRKSSASNALNHPHRKTPASCENQQNDATKLTNAVSDTHHEEFVNNNIVAVDTSEAIALPRSNANPIASHDEETLFALSLVGSLKRLPPQKFAAAKCHILTYLMQLEYGDATTPPS